MVFIYLSIATPLIWLVMYCFFYRYSFSEHLEYPERFLRGIYSNSSLWKIIKNTFRNDYRSKFKWFASTKLRIVFILTVVCILSSLFIKVSLFSIILLVYYVGSSAYYIAQIKCAKLALNALTGELSILSMDKLSKKWGDI